VSLIVSLLNLYDFSFGFDAIFERFRD